MKKIFTLTLILGFFTLASFGQDADQSKDMAARADVLSQFKTIAPPLSGKQLKRQERQERREARLLRRAQRTARHMRLRRSFHHQHSLIKTRR